MLQYKCLHITALLARAYNVLDTVALVNYTLGSWEQFLWTFA